MTQQEVINIIKSEFPKARISVHSPGRLFVSFGIVRPMVLQMYAEDLQRLFPSSTQVKRGTFGVSDGQLIVSFV